MKPCVMIAGGGTGGHLFPGIAVAGAIRELNPKVRLVFVGAGKDLEKSILADKGFETESLKAKALRGQGLVGRFQSLASLPKTFWAAKKLLDKYKPSLVLAVGGYAAFALGLCARVFSVPLAVQEQNALPGLTNKVLGKFAQQVFTSFKEAEDYFPKGKVSLMGNPVRLDLLAQGQKAALERKKPQEIFNLLILGGSQGAMSINRALIEALPFLEDLKDKLFFYHQTGEQGLKETRKAYEEKGFNANVAAFFNDMGELYGNAHFVICRAGAGTLTELTALGRPGLCVPYPFAAGDHQTKNAQSLVNANAAKLIKDDKLNGKAVSLLIRDFLKDPKILETMSQNALLLGKPEAAKLIALKCLDLMEVKA